MNLAHRQRAEEWMDARGVDPDALRRSLKFIRRVITLFGYTRSTLSHFERFSRSWRPGERITVIDFATGSADVPQAIDRWARRRGFDVRIVGVDLHETTAREARRACGDNPRIRIVRGDVLDLPFDSLSFDYALSGMFLHHLSETDAAGVLEAMNRVARRGIIAADLLRRRRAYAWVKLVTLASDPMVKHDARVSVAQAFSPSEVLALRDRAGVGFAAFHEHFGHRFVLAGEKPL
jgi:SAM-dependent methyltransferase